MPPPYEERRGGRSTTCKVIGEAARSVSQSLKDRHPQVPCWCMNTSASIQIVPDPGYGA